MLNGWKKASIGEIGRVITGTTPATATPEYYGGEIPFIAPGNLGKTLFVYDAERTLTAEGLAQAKALPPGAVLFTCIGATIGKSAIAGRELATNQQINAIICDPQKADSAFVYYLLDMRAEAIKRLAGAQAVPIVNKSTFEDVTAPFPPLPEQRKIAEILRTWDEALEKLTALRAAKARRLGGLGRALLDRAADDPATVSKPLAGLARIVKGQQLNKLDIAKGEYPVWNGGITPSGFHDDWNTEGGTITISEGGNSCGFVNLAKRRFWLGGHCYALQDLSNETERDFLFHTLKAREAEIMRLRVGSGLPNIQRADLERLPVVVPPLGMQRQIARALTKGNEELALLEAEIEALTRQKRGLMQKLLTGEWRVPLDPAEPPAATEETAHAG